MKLCPEDKQVCVLLHVKLSSAVMFIMRLSPFLSPFLSASSTNNSEGDSLEVAGAAGCTCICEDQRESTASTAPCSPLENVAAMTSY